MASFKMRVKSAYVGPSCDEAADAPHEFRLYETKARGTGEVQIAAYEGRITPDGGFQQLLGGERAPGNRGLVAGTGATRATAKVLAGGAATVLAELHRRGWIAELPSSAEVAAAIN